MLSDAEMRRRMEKGWRGGMEEKTPCGQSSMRKWTLSIRRWLPEVVKNYSIESINDAGAGDMHWIKRVDWDVDYRPFDLFPRCHSVTEIDISKEVMPPADAILCRMVLNHLCDTRVKMALANFKESAGFLIATHFVGDLRGNNREFTRLDLTKWLGEPLEMVEDGHEKGCRLALWDL